MRKPNQHVVGGSSAAGQSATVMGERPTEANGTYRGPERRGFPSSPMAGWLSLMLDEIDYGMLLLSTGGRVLHANHAAREQLDDRHPLQLLGSDLVARREPDVTDLRTAIDGTRRGLRRLLSLGEPSCRVSVAIVPLPDLQAGYLALLMMGKRQVCQRLSVQCFAQAHVLTIAETRVLEALCSGLGPREVASQHQVGLSTVRTQIGHVRAKVGADSIRDLVRQVAVLPPMVSSLRSLRS